TDGFITHQPDGDERFAFTRRRLLRGQLLYAPMVASEWRSRLVLSATDYAGQPDYNMERGTAGEDFRRTSYANAPSEDVVETLLLSWENTLRLGPSLGLTSITALMDSRQAYVRDFDGLEEEGGTNPATAEGLNLSQELRLDWEPSSTLRGIVGLYGGRFDDAYVYSSEDIRVPASYFAPLPLAGELIEVRTDFYSEQFNEAVNGAVFAEFDWDWRPWLSLTFGLRYDRETLDARNRNETTRADAYLASPSGVQQLPFAGDVLGAILGAQPGIDILTLANATGIAPQTDGLQGGETTYEALLPKLGLRLALSKNWMTFATYSEAYRAGGVSVDGSSGEVYPYDPEYTVNGEIGLRGKVLAGALESSLNLFYTDWTDQQVPVLQNQFYIVQNAGKSRLYGAEASLRWRPSPRWKGDLGLGYVDTQFLEYEDGDNSYRGNDFPLAPPVSASIGGQWMHPQGWEVGLRFSYQDHAFTRPSNSEDEYSESRRLLSARMGWQGQHWAVFLSGSNLLDEDYATETFQFPEGYVGADGARGYGAYGAPRTLSLSLEWQL
ncbi:MAG: TonB-dependent receptor, partial [Oceanococcaceae bacterium]